MPYKLALILVTPLILQACNDYQSSSITLDDLNRDMTDPDPKSGGLFSGEKGYFEITPDDLSSDKK